MISEIKKVTIINIKLPFMLRWMKKYVNLEVKRLELPMKLRGYEADRIIIDEVTYDEK